MSDKDYAKQKKRIQKYIDKWFRTMGLGWFRIQFEWDRERKYDSADTAALTTSSWQYKEATIVWYLPKLAEMDEDHVEATVVHEFSHVLLSGLAQHLPDENSSANQINEYTTELVANAVMWSRGDRK